MSTIIKGKNANRPWTVRYWHEGRQRERSFRTRREAHDFRTRFEHESREHSYVDPRAGAEPFSVSMRRWLDRHPGRPNTVQQYRSVVRNHLDAALGARRLRDVAGDREGVEALLLTDLPGKGLSRSMAVAARNILTGTCTAEVKAGKIAGHRLAGIRLPAPVARAEFYNPTHAEVTKLAEGMGNLGPAIWLMRLTGLRIGEVLGLEWGDVHDGVVRVSRQRLANGTIGPLKHRREGQFRDVPLPAQAARLLAGIPGRPPASGRAVFPTLDRSTVNYRFSRAAKAAGLPEGFRPHDLRHAYASACLSSGVAISDLSHWLGHASIQTTYGLYSHMTAPALDAGRVALERQFADWAA